ncbi:anti-sigma factor [Demequina muriae]|uniref:Anti-sigma factor n=1 Tax=Demequina muriae TaxID=3051664 RepID=A0ABT8GH16_9MICO|nr:anti-sigma factor [Demequina sp. EGI L300058]MDN4480733.1 anti-sigma factor [Demequina sp. EGI L300058]
MSHLDDDVLAELALGGGSASDAEHAATCTECRGELESLRAMVARVQMAGPGGDLLTPPDRVWSAIAAEVDSENAALDSPRDAEHESDGSTPALATAGDDDLAVRRPRRGSRWSLAAAAAAGVVVGGIGVGAALGINGGDEPAAIVAQAPLTDLSTEAPAGDAVVETRDDGTQVIVIDTDTRDVDDAYLEVWLIDEAIEGMVSLGHLTGGSGEFVLPPGFDISDFPIVDISVEPLDGVPTHSGDSVTRGVLET